MNNFRVWSNKKNKYVATGDTNDGTGFDEYTLNSQGTLFTYSWRTGDTYEVDVAPEMFPVADLDARVEHFSGVYDIQNTPIFPGDIVQVTVDNVHFSGYIVNFEVRYSQGAHYLVYGDLYSVEWSDFLDRNNLDVLVVGNIHENYDILGVAGEVYED